LKKIVILPQFFFFLWIIEAVIYMQKKIGDKSSGCLMFKKPEYLTSGCLWSCSENLLEK